MTGSTTYPRLIESIDALRRRWRGLRVAEGLLLATAVLGLVLILAVGTDNLLAPGFGGRWLLAGTILAALVVASLGLVVSRLLDDHRDDYFAALVEQSHPELNNRLINALQLGKGNEMGVSPGLIAAIVDDAGRATADLEWDKSLDRRTLLRSTGLAAAAVVFLIGYAIATPARFGNGLARVLFPMGNIAPYTSTQVLDATVKPGNVRVPEGSTVTIEARVAGVVPARAAILREFEVGNSKTHPMFAGRETQDRFTGVLPDVRTSFSYEVRAGDGRSRKFQVTVVPRPKVAGLTLSASPPPYAPGPARVANGFDGEIANLTGGSVKLGVKATKPLREASLITDRGETIAMAKSTGDDRSWSAAFTLWSKDAKGDVPSSRVEAPTRYRVRLVDTEGFENEDPVWHAIASFADAPPSVAITSPGRDLQVKPGTLLPLSVSSRDDLGLGEVRLVYRVNDSTEVRELARFPHNEKSPLLQADDRFDWSLTSGGLKAGDLVTYWAEAADRNTITGPGRAESRRFTLALVTPETAVGKLEMLVSDYAQAIEELARLQRENRAQTGSGVAAESLVAREVKIRSGTRIVARAMEKDALPVASLVKALDDLHAGLMAQALAGLESARDTTVADKANEARKASLPIQDKIIAELDAILARLQKNEQAKKELRKIAKNDKAAHLALTTQLGQMIKDLDRLLKDETELAGKFEKMPKKTAEEVKEDAAKAAKELEEFQKKWNAWAKGTVNELAKLPTGFVEDFQLRPDVNKIFEEIEKAANRAKAEKLEISLEDLGTGLEEQATKMKEDLEMWMPDAPDAAKWVLEEPINPKGMKIPEMTLPKALEDLVGDLLQKADEFDEEADDMTSAWGANLDQAGWGVGDGPISTFSAKGKTGNDQPNNNELGGRSGDGRRGKSSGQMVGDTSRALPGRKTPARVGNEQYEPGQLKQEAQDDPNGATGGGKKAGTGRKGLQGGSPPDFIKDMGRLSEKQAGLREKAEQVAKKLDAVGLSGRRLDGAISSMKASEADLRDLRYADAARKRREAMSALRSGLTDLDRSTAARLSRARDLAPELRKELLQSSDEGYPAGYEGLLKNYYKTLSAPEK